MVYRQILRTVMAAYFVISIGIDASAQVEWRDSLYAAIDRTTHDYTAGDGEILQFDYYVADGAAAKRPLVVYVHGGGFSGGARDGKNIVTFAERLASRGYAVASVSYRLTMKGIGFGCDVPAEAKVATIDGASFDVSRALKVILNDTGTFQVDRAKVILAGSSAGAEVVLNLAYVYENPVLPSDLSYAGVIGMAGAITTLEKISAGRAIPAQLFHGTGDQLVPYGIAPHHYCSGGDDGYLVLYGSGPIAQRLKGLGTAYCLYAEQGGSHSWAGRPMWECFDEVVDFLYHDIVAPSSVRQTERILVRQ